MIRVGELFAGIGGIGLGLEMAGGFEVAWQVERDPYAQKVLAKNWPGLPIHDDVTTFPPDNSDEWKVDMITGGFPCQDISVAGKGAGLHGHRSGLFFEIIRIAGVLQPRFLLLENVPALLTRGLPEVLGALAQSGYDAQWRVLSAAEMGAPHLRKRIFIFATLADTDGKSEPPGRRKQRPAEIKTTTDANHGYKQPEKEVCPRGHAAESSDPTMADADRTRLQIRPGEEPSGEKPQGGAVSERSHCDGSETTAIRECGDGNISDPYGLPGTQHRHDSGMGGHGQSVSKWWAESRADFWAIEPALGRVANGVPHRVDRLKCLGNAVVPQCVEWLAHEWILPAIKSR